VTNVEVDLAGLRRLSGVCDERAAAVDSIGVALTASSTFTASASSVASMREDVSLTGTQIAGRLRATAGLVTSAATGYGTTDTHNAIDLAAVGQGIYEV
jgi:hypothetical protein